MAILLFVVGLVFLIVGAEALVRGASRLAAVFGISPLVIGLTVVAFGTSSPELAVSVKSAFSGQASIAVGNVVGSNIFNVLFILGLSAMIVPLAVSQQLVRLDVPLMIALSILVLVLALDEHLSRVNGLLLVAILVAYLSFLIYQGRRQSTGAAEEYSRGSGTGGPPKANRKSDRVKDISLVMGGLALLVLGSRWLVDSAVDFARYLGVSELVVGLTIVAAGTSLPEVVTSVIAAMRGERDIAVGNVVGSNLFNIMGVLGITSMIAPAGMEVSAAVIGFDLPVMIAVTLACLPMFFTRGVISRQEGALLLGYYVAYTLYLVLATSQHDALPGINVAMLCFVIPLTVLFLMISALREIRRRKTALPE